MQVKAHVVSLKSGDASAVDTAVIVVPDHVRHGDATTSPKGLCAASADDA